MHILNELTVKNLKQNKKRTVVTIFGIMLSVALITAITAFVSSMQGSMIERAKKYDGNYHILVSEVPCEQQESLLNHEKVEKTMLGQTLAHGTTDELFGIEDWEWEDAKPQAKVRAFDEEALHQMGIQLNEGRLPENEQEILFPVWLAGMYDRNYHVGDEITLYIAGKARNYTISGFLLHTSFEFWTVDGNPGYTLITKLDHDTSGEVLDIALTMKEPKDAYRFYENLKEVQGFEEEQLVTNDELLKFQGVAKSERMMEILYSMAAIVIMIIVFTSVFVIKNSFDISIMERQKQYGMLASVGATSRQIRKNVLFEGIILGTIAIPLGVLSGIFAIWLTLLVVMKILEGSSLAEDFALTLHVSIGAVAIAVVIAVVTIYISSLLPARKAAKVSPIDAIRENKNVKIVNKKLRTSKLLQKMLGVEGEIASKNLKRSRKKYRTTVFSIFLSVVLFISISSLLKYGFLVQSMEYREMDYNLVCYPERESEVDEGSKFMKLCEKAMGVDGIDEATMVKRSMANVSEGNYSQEAIGDEVTGYHSPEELDEFTYIRFVSIPDEQYRDYLKKIGLSYEEANGKAVISDTARKEYWDDKGQLHRMQYQVLNSKKGELLSYVMASGEEENRKAGQIEIAKRTEELPFGIVNDYYGEIVAVISNEQMEQMEPGFDGIYIQAKDTQKVQENIEALDANESWNFWDLEADARERNSIILIISIFLYGFIAVISVIGITNVFNTITTNMALRNREFAILKSIGMTDKEFRRMIRYESVLYGIKALAFGVPVGVFLSYMLYKRFVGIMEVPYVIPWTQIGIASVFVFLIIFITMGYSVRKTRNQNIIETIRSENV